MPKRDVVYAAAPTPVEFNQLVALFDAGRYAELEARARLLLGRYPESGPVWQMLGASLQMQGKDGLDAMRRAVQLLPDDVDAHINLGNALRDLGQLNNAVASYRRALEIKPDFAGAHYNLGNALKDLGRFDDAVASYRRALKIEPDFVAAHGNLGNVLRDLGRLDDAVASYSRALEIRPDAIGEHYNLGNALRDLGRLDDAVASYRRALEIKPDFAEAHGNLGNALRDLGRLDDAVASYHRALEIKPDFAEAYGNLGGALMTQGKRDDALVCFQRQLRLTPGNEEAGHLIASLTGNNPDRAPIQYVESVFDNYAATFDTHLRQVLKYDTPEKLVALIAQHSTPPAAKWNVLDLGCGTGLAGLAIAPFARQLVGVDVSSKMLEKARARNLYQRLEHLDLLTMMRGEKASTYDAIIAADVFIYSGSLEEIISEIKRLLCPGGVFAFSIEALGVASVEEAGQGGRQDYRLQNNGRYAHSADYIKRLALTNGFLCKEMEATQIRLENDRSANGYLALWKS